MAAVGSPRDGDKEKKDNEGCSVEQRDDRRPSDTDAAVQLALDVNGQSYSPWSASLLRLYAVLIIPYLNGCLNGYDGSLMGGLNGMTSYQRYFNM
jgi:hypothetical protein